MSGATLPIYHKKKFQLISFSISNFFQGRLFGKIVTHQFSNLSHKRHLHVQNSKSRQSQTSACNSRLCSTKEQPSMSFSSSCSWGSTCCSTSFHRDSGWVYAVRIAAMLQLDLVTHYTLSIWGQKEIKWDVSFKSSLSFKLKKYIMATQIMSLFLKLYQEPRENYIMNIAAG